jgi:hypothetical protein
VAASTKFQQRCLQSAVFGGIIKVKACSTTSILAGKVPRNSPSASTNKRSGEEPYRLVVVNTDDSGSG